MLAVSAFLLAVGAFAVLSEPFFHRREGASEISHLRSDVGDVLFGGHACRSLRREPRVSAQPSASSRLAKNGSPRDTASAMPATRRAGWRRRAATEAAPGAPADAGMPVLEVAVSADHDNQFHSAVVHFCGSEDNARGSNLKATRPQSRCEI